ncbi:MAG: hypothetical protein U5K76_04150 [Woeseiaceae bacterium]|nr:hypothetical protein [Woeseiaceae bacterium]
MHELLPVVQQVLQAPLSLGRRVDHVARGAAFQVCARFCAKIQLHILDSTADMDSHIRGQHASLDHLGAFVQGSPVAQRLLGGGIRLVLGDVRVFEQLVRGRHDVFDLRAGACLQQGQGVDQHGGIGDQLRRLLELGQRDAGVDTALQDRGRFHLADHGRQGRQVVVGLAGSNVAIGRSPACRRAQAGRAWRVLRDYMSKSR